LQAVPELMAVVARRVARDWQELNHPGSDGGSVYWIPTTGWSACRAA
jgi:hypothetical protein